MMRADPEIPAAIIPGSQTPAAIVLETSAARIPKTRMQFLTLSSLLQAVNMEYNPQLRVGEINRLHSG
jgi:hypothetical protein